MSGGRDWTTGEVRKLHEMRANGIKTKEIAAVLGRSSNAISSFIRDAREKNNQPRPMYRINEWTPEQIEALRQLADDGLTAIEAGKELGRSEHAVRTIASRVGIRFNRYGGTLMFDRETYIRKSHARKGSAELLSAIQNAGLHP